MMERFFIFSAFNLMFGVAFLWNVTGGASAAAPTPSPPPQLPSYYQPLEAEAMHSILKSWTDSGTNVSTTLPGWSLDTHPCSYTRKVNWTGVSCNRKLVHVGNLTGYDWTLYQLVMIGYTSGPKADAEIVGELPLAIMNLSNIEGIYIIDHRRLSGPLPIGILFNKALPSMTTLTLRGCNMSGSITIDAAKNRTYAINEVEYHTSKLKYLDLATNSFNGSIDFCTPKVHISSLVRLNFSSNQLSGTFCCGEVPFLDYIDISYNQFTDIQIFDPDVYTYVLKSIFAQHNLLQRLPSQLLKLPELQEIYFDFNNISGVLTLPYVSPTNSSLRFISLVNNNITGLHPTNDSSSLFSESSLRISDLLFLGGNPICKDSRKNDLLRMVCRFNRSSPIEDPYDEPNKTLIIMSASISAFVLVALIITLFVITKLMKKISIMREIQNEFNKKDVKPNLYSYTELKIATQDFHSNNELGRGGFGVVYKGILIDGSKVAVKRLTKSKTEQGLQDFLNEIIVISKIKHRNLVQLKGCCIRGDQRILVYELVDNKNLADTLWGQSNQGHLDWVTRFNIILGIARGLAYLHEEVEPSIIHRDIKGPNILLDKDLNPKIADFGLALFFPLLDDGETHMNVSKIAGTMGYLSPEYATYGQVSTKLDVFSFGVLVLEIVSGRKNIDNKLSSSQQWLCQWGQRLLENNHLSALVDKSLQEVTMTEESTIKKVVEVGLLCLHHIAARRPTMSEIVAMLIGNKEINQVLFEEYRQTYPQADNSTSSNLPSTQDPYLSEVEEESSLR